VGGSAKVQVRCPAAMIAATAGPLGRREERGRSGAPEGRAAVTGVSRRAGGPRRVTEVSRRGGAGGPRWQGEAGAGPG
jgi:hypothetical protein